MGTRGPGSNSDMGMGVFNKQVYPIYNVLFSSEKLRCEWEKNIMSGSLY